VREMGEARRVVAPERGRTVPGRTERTGGDEKERAGAE